MTKLTKEDVLLCVSRAVAPYSNYIGDQVHLLHMKRVEDGERGYAPRQDLILSRLNQLVKDGLLTRSQFTMGYYGYVWEFTPAGRAALEARDSD